MQVIVRDNNVDQALRVLKKKMQREGVFREMKRRKAYEKPSDVRARPLGNRLNAKLYPRAEKAGACAPSGAAAQVVLSLLRTRCLL